MLESRLVELGLVPSKSDFTDGISTTNQIVVTNLKVIYYEWETAVELRSSSFLMKNITWMMTVARS